MIIKCKNCDAAFDDSLNSCPYCGARKEDPKTGWQATTFKEDPLSDKGVRPQYASTVSPYGRKDTPPYGAANGAAGGNYGEPYQNGQPQSAYLRQDAGWSAQQGTAGFTRQGGGWQAQSRFTQAEVENDNLMKAILPEKYRPISLWGYIGYMLLFSIPIVGLVLMIVYAFSGGTNANLKNFARAYLVLLAIGIGLVIIFSAILIPTLSLLSEW